MFRELYNGDVNRAASTGSVQNDSESGYARLGRRYAGSDFTDDLRRMAQVGERLGEGIPATGDFPDLGLFQLAIDDLGAQLDRAVLGLRAQGATWQNVADGLGVTRSAAFQRFAKLEREGS